MTYFLHYLPPPRRRTLTFAGQVALAALGLLIAFLLYAVAS